MSSPGRRAVVRAFRMDPVEQVRPSYASEVPRLSPLTPVAGAVTAAPPISRPTSGPTTGSRSASTRILFPFRLEILGFPVARLEVASDRPLALVVARLCDVWPDGASTLITRGLMNLSHHAGHEEPQDLVPGERFVAEVTAQLDRLLGPSRAPPSSCHLAFILAVGLAVPEPVTLSLFVGGASSLQLPLADGIAAYLPPEHFSSPEQAATPAHSPAGSAGRHSRTVLRDVASGTVEFVSRTSASEPLRLLESGLEYSEDECDLHRIVEGEPLSAFASSERADRDRPGRLAHKRSGRSAPCPRRPKSSS